MNNLATTVQTPAKWVGRERALHVGTQPCDADRCSYIGRAPGIHLAHIGHEKYGGTTLGSLAGIPFGIPRVVVQILTRGELQWIDEDRHDHFTAFLCGAGHQLLVTRV